MLPLRPWDPERIGGYVVLGRLGAGAMGRVYLGRSASGRLVAVKTVRVELAEEPDFRTRFAREVAAARRVSGAFTAAVVAADPDADVPWLATAYVPAPTLSLLVRECGPLPVPAVRWLAAGCAEALESIHAAGIVHRDLKPSNVLVAPDGPRVIDFGIARAAERASHTIAQGTIGTPAFMAPEQAKDVRRASPASDVYSLGATMLLAATGHGPYRGDSALEVLTRLTSAPPDLSGLAADLREVVSACLAPDPLDRPTSAALLAAVAGDLGQAGQAIDLGVRLLPPPALALIGRYRREPPTDTAEPARDSQVPGTGPAEFEPTIGSLGARSLPDLAEEPASLWRSLDTLGSGPSATGSDRHAGREPRAGHRQPSRAGRALIALAVAAAVAGLLAGGGLIGAALSRGPAKTAGNPRSGDVLPLAGPGGQGQDAAQRVHALASRTGRPAMAVAQPMGDPATGFVVIGAGWPRDKQVTIRLAGIGVSPDPPVADQQGNFNYVINQAHEFFRRGIPPGLYTVVATCGPVRVTAMFSVMTHPPGPPGP
ncbi:MAG TPA: serine/threonine-protein kinase [Streptosporangiaceae bacterium]